MQAGWTYCSAPATCSGPVECLQLLLESREHYTILEKDLAGRTCGNGVMRDASEQDVSLLGPVMADLEC